MCSYYVLYYLDKIHSVGISQIFTESFNTVGKIYSIKQKNLREKL